MKRADLKDRLTRHPAADTLETEHLERMHALLGVDGDPFHRNHFEPGHFTACFLYD